MMRDLHRRIGLNKERYRAIIEENPLRKVRQEIGLSLPELASHLEVSGQAIHYWEMGSVIPSHHNMVKIAKFLGLKVDKLERKWDAWHKKLQSSSKDLSK